MAQTTTGHKLYFETDHMIKKDNVKLLICSDNKNN